MTEPLEFTAVAVMLKDDKVSLKIGNCGPFYSRDIFPNKRFNGSAWEKERTLSYINRTSLPGH